MKVIAGRAPDRYDASMWQRILANIENGFTQILNPVRHTTDKALNFSAPGAVPGVTDQNVTMVGVLLGDKVEVGCSITAPAGFMPPVGFVSASDTVTVRWLQVTGVAADPDGAGATYYIDVWKR